MNDNELVVERKMFSLYGQRYLLYGPYGIYCARCISESFLK